MNFLDLPRELRDIIYTYVLVFKPSLVILSPALRIPYSFGVDGPSFERPKPHEWAPGLLLTNKLVSREALEILYLKNTFEFHEMEPWGPLYDFLAQIGPLNRKLLRQLEVTIYEPRIVIRSTDGSRLALKKDPDDLSYGSERATYPYDSELHGPLPQSGEFPEQSFVHHIDPLIRSCIKLLSPQYFDGETLGIRYPQVQLMLLLPVSRLPGYGSKVTYWEEAFPVSPWSAEIPDLIERLVRDHCAIPVSSLDSAAHVSSSVGVTYRGRFDSYWLTPGIQKDIQKIGWKVVDHIPDPSSSKSIFQKDIIWFRRLLPDNLILEDNR